MEMRKAMLMMPALISIMMRMVLMVLMETSRIQLTTVVSTGFQTVRLRPPQLLMLVLTVRSN
jgi:hypothetical protein